MYTRGAPPPAGRRLNLVDPAGRRVVWTGRRWYDPLTGDDAGPTRAYRTWPPPGSGPWTSLTPVEPRPAPTNAPSCTCPELYAGVNPTGCHNLSHACRVHGAGTPGWTELQRRARDRLRAAWAEVHAARARRDTL